MMQKQLKRSTPSPVRRRQEDRTALSDERMTKAAIDLLLKHGVAGTTLAAIGARAGYSRGLVTHRFGSKAGLLAHLVEFLGAQWRRRLEAAVAGHGGLSALDSAIDALTHFAVEQPDELWVMYLLWFHSIDPSAEHKANVAAVHKAQWRDLARWIEQGQVAGEIDAGVVPKRAAIMIASAIAGLMFQWSVTPSLPIAELHQQLKLDVKRVLSRDPGRA